MAQISRFFGVIISMYFDDHNPPHFHARYAEFECEIDLKTLSIMEGDLPPRVLGLVIEWATMHKEELLENWTIMENKQSFKKIEPLK